MPVSRRGFMQGTVAAAAMAGMGISHHHTAPKLTWILAAEAFDNLNNPRLDGSPKVCQSAFNRGTTFFSVRYASGKFATTPVPAGFLGTAVLKFEAYSNGSTGLVDAIRAGLPSWVQAVQYDPEEWAFTPQIEQGSFLFNSFTGLSYAQQFCETAHQHGLRVLLTPANDLCNRDPNPAYPNSAPQYPLDQHDLGHDYHAFFRHDLASATQFLTAGDVFQYQSQQLELDTTTFQTVTTNILKQAMTANPAITFLGGLGRSIPPSDGATAAQLTAAAKSVAPTVTSGFWLNVDAFTSQVKPMIEMLKNLGF